MKVDEKTGEKIPETPEEAFQLWDENLANMDHCCECEHGIEHYVCVQYCNATSKQNCIWKWKGTQRIVRAKDFTPEKCYVKEMTYQEWENYSKAHKLVRFNDLGLSS